MKPEARATLALAYALTGSVQGEATDGHPAGEVVP
jgi:hypothetical protein